MAATSLGGPGGEQEVADEGLDDDGSSRPGQRPRASATRTMAMAAPLLYLGKEKGQPRGGIAKNDSIHGEAVRG
jgi:hypothetical protein